MDESERTPEAWGEDYRRLLPTYEAFAEKLRGLLKDLLDEQRLPVVHIESRAKQVESLVGKVKRKADTYAKPLEEVTDLAGVRVITYYIEDLDIVRELIHREFDVDEQHSLQKGGDFDADRFGYVSDHYVVRIAAPRRELGEWRAFEGLTAEIQVRTATQHAWAAVEHRLGYKLATQLPKDLQRRLYRLSALFELADEQFSGVVRQPKHCNRSTATPFGSGTSMCP